MRGKKGQENREDYLVIRKKKVYYKARKTLAQEDECDENCRFGRRFKYGA